MEHATNTTKTTAGSAAKGKRIHLAMETQSPPDRRGRPRDVAVWETTRPACAQVRSPRFRMSATNDLARVDCERCKASRTYAERKQEVAAKATDTVVWHVDGKAYECERVPGTCPLCGAPDAVIQLPAPLLAKQPDDTTHVCVPAFGGCNHGFAMSPVAR